MGFISFCSDKLVTFYILRWNTTNFFKCNTACYMFRRTSTIFRRWST